MSLLIAACGGSSTPATQYTTQSGQIIAPDGQTLQLRGLNMFGFDTAIMIPQYLDKMGWKDQIAQVKSLGFNAVRLPFVPETLYSPLRVGIDLNTYVDPVLNADLAGLTPLQVMDLWMAEADRQGLYVVLDFHSVSKGVLLPVWHVEDPTVYAAGGSAPTYNGEPYTTDDWLHDLQFVAARYASNAHLVGIDLYNEPHGVVRWGPGDAAVYQPENDWKIAAETAASAVLSANPNLLIFVQGIAQNNDGIENSTIPVNYGENLQAEAYRPLDIPDDKLVLFPHTYGPDLHDGYKSTFDDPSFPANLAADWEALFGKYVSVPATASDHAVILGEFGGNYGAGSSGDKDKQWQDALVTYLIAKNMRSSFYWCYTPNSVDTGGILDNNLNVRTDKIALLHRLFGI